MAALKDRIATDIWEKLQQAASKFKGSHKVTAISCYCKLTAKAWHAWHRRWIKTEEKAKVVASVWGAEFIQFLAAIAVLYWTISRTGYITSVIASIHPILQNRPRENS